MADLVWGASHALATVAATALQIFPDRFVIALRNKLTLRRFLDYDRALITLFVTSRVEHEVRLRSCAKEPETVEWIHQTFRPGDVLYDIGANVGAYSLVAANWTNGQATVYAFEPGYPTFPNLIENIFTNRCDQTIIPFQVALGSQTALAEFCYSTLDPGGARHFGIRDARGQVPVVRKHAVLSYRLDDFVRPFDLRLPTHIKIDVDGSELELLEGAEEVLGSPSLRWILVEVDESESDLQSVRTLLEGRGFHLECDHQHADGITHNWIFKRKDSVDRNRQLDVVWRHPTRKPNNSH